MPDAHRFQLRSYAFIDRMQPQSAAHVAATCQGDVPVAGMSELFIEVAPGTEKIASAKGFRVLRVPGAAA